MAGVRVGSVEVIPISDGSFRRSPAQFFPDVPEAAWELYRDHLDDHGQLGLNLGSFLLRADGRTLLVDTGLGTRAAPGDLGGPRLPDRLREAGVSPEQVEYVLTTHMHFDHTGWNTVDTDDGPAPMFPRARYLVQRAEWEFWMQPAGVETPHLTERAVELLEQTARPLAQAGLLEPVEGEHAPVPSVRFLPTPGHTPGHACILIDSGSERAVILGDVAHTPVQVTEPAWSIGADVDKEQGRRTRAALWDRIEEHGLTVCAGHFAPPNVGRFVRVAGKRTWRAL